ncbi:penicillin-binding protein activator [Arenimonas sp. MALMAid1274]|uniref:penicillin-binding protein activator n=1 Tax=Arenimonas sp. MALMAid1274 TaxID=3411630 RepID=UPI003B9F306D
MSRFATLLLALALMSGCASVSVAPETSGVQVSAQRLAEEGKHLEAARAWADSAVGSRGAARDRAWLYAADQYWLAGDKGASRQALSQAGKRRLEGRDLLLHDLMNAHFLADAAQWPEALALLGQSRESVPAALRARWHGLRAQALEGTGRGFDAAGELAWLHESLDRGARAENVRRIDKLLAAQSDALLASGAAALPPGHPLYRYAGRALTQRGLPLPRPYDREASSPGLDALPAADRDGYRPPERLAALLPLSGPLAAAGHSVRDGLLAAYYGEVRRRPQLKFYDTHGSGGVRAAFAQAREDGAQMLVGPLTRDEVNELFGLAELDLPVLALNRGTIPPPPGSAAYALSPEDEGAAAADRLVDRGLRRVLVVTQADDNAQRALAAFRERLTARGGQIIGETSVSEGNPDYVPALRQAMQGGRPEAIFLSLKAAQARLLSSQMDTAALTGVPRVATSLILSGANLRMDTELDGIEYPELPWLLGLRGSPDPDTLGRTLPSAQGGGSRLFAFGMDAWQLAAYLDHLASDPGAQVRGATGELQLDGFGGVQRKPAWAVFSGGRSRPALDGALLPDAGAP